MVEAEEAENIPDSKNIPWFRLLISSLSSTTVLLHMHDRPKHKGSKPKHEGTFWSHFSFQIFILAENLLFANMPKLLEKYYVEDDVECYFRVENCK